jgi:purine-binding chemotaxis protein CheW
MNGAAIRGNGLVGEGEISLCSMSLGRELFGIDTSKVREVLGPSLLRTVPLSPGYIAGIIPYRGDVLTTLSFRALLGRPESSCAGCVLVLDDEESGERLGLMVDGVGGVVTVRKDTLEANPSTLDARSKALFDGAYKMTAGLIVRIDPQRLRPGLLAATGLFVDGLRGDGVCAR